MNRSSKRSVPARLATREPTSPRSHWTRDPESGAPDNGRSPSPASDVAATHFEASCRFERLLLARLRALEDTAPRRPRLIW
ncbi:MAG: hypothetical protein K8J08_04615 [Thermoanaerobaculia bacterium]|nr:hypothetical protein [Thermoanaerobaculia bacterium]